jgi:hypothetical protein
MRPIDISRFDLTQVPTAEDDQFEFKCSATSENDLKKKLPCAVSAFANSGGGCFIVGVDSMGNADGGISSKIGSTELCDWADQIIRHVEPTPEYSRKVITDPLGRGCIKPDCVVLVVLIEESSFGPHMAPDKKYYIRAGAHTEPARQFIIESIWAKRHFSKPRLTHLFRLKPALEEVVQLGIVALTESPALDVQISLAPKCLFLRCRDVECRGRIRQKRPAFRQIHRHGRK